MKFSIDSDVITVDSDINDGLPSISDTEISIAQILLDLADGHSINDICEEHSCDELSIIQLLNDLAEAFR